jgi:hypothetical protein
VSESGHQTRTDESSEDEQSSSVGGDGDADNDADKDENEDGSDVDAVDRGSAGTCIQHNEVTQSWWRPKNTRDSMLTDGGVGRPGNDERRLVLAEELVSNTID